MSGKHLNDISKVYLDTIANVKKAETDADIKRWEDLGGPTPGNYRADDNSAKLKEGRRLRKSDWRQDLKEVIDKPETEEKAEKKVDEKKGIKNKVVINPTFKEAIEEIGGELLEVNAVDSVEKTQDDTQRKQEQHRKQVESKQKRMAAMKKLVLRKKFQAVSQGGGEDITAGYEPEGEVVVEKDLNAAERRALPNKDFVFPGKGEGPEGKQRGAYPINDKKHARAALAMAAAHASPEKEAKVKAAVKKKYPEIEVQSEWVVPAAKAAGKWAVRQGIKVGGKAGGKFVKSAGKEAVKAAGEVAVEAGKGAVDAAKKRGRKAGEDFATNVGKKKEVDEGVAAPAKKQEGKGEKIGKTVGSIAGGVAGSAAVAGPTLGVGSIAAGIAGSTAGEKVGGEIGKKFDKKKPVKEGVLKMVKTIGRAGRPKTTVKKAKMDDVTDKLHDWRQKNSPEQKEREKYVSPFRPIVKEADDKAYKYVVGMLKKKYGNDAVLTKGQKPKPPTAAQQKKNAEIRAKRAKEDHRDPTEKASDGRYSDRHSNRGSD